jgi:hypothetical protein
MKKIYDGIMAKTGIDENPGELICTLPDLPLAVPRGKYSADLYRSFMKLHG